MLQLRHALEVALWDELTSGSKPAWALCFVLRRLIKAVARKFFLRGVSGKASALWPDLYAYFITTSSSDKSKAQI